MTENMRVSRGDALMQVALHGEGPPLLHLHGLLGFGKVAAAEAPPGYTVATYDQRGHGDGTRFTEPAAYAIEEFVRDTMAVLDALQWNRVTMVGTSMGAAIATRIALDHPERVNRLALIGPAFADAVNEGLETFDGIAAGLDAVGIDGVVPLIRAAQTGRGFPVDATAYLDDWPAHDARALAAALRTVGRWVPFPDLRALGAIRVPAFVVGWPDDPIHPLQLAERVGAMLRAPLARLSGAAEVLQSPAAVSGALASIMPAAVPAAEVG